MADKKARERWLFDRACLLTDVWPDGEVDDQGEQPDIVLLAGGIRIGVEITERINSRARAAEEALRQVCDDAFKLFRDSFDPPYPHVKIVFKRDRRLGKKNKQAAAEEITSVVASRYPYSKGSTRLEEGDDFESTNLASIYVHFESRLSSNFWGQAGAWWVPRVGPDDLQEVISSKEHKVPKYRERADRLWLLIAANGFSGSTSGSIDEECYGHGYMSSFDGIVLFDQAANRVSALHLLRMEVGNP